MGGPDVDRRPAGMEARRRQRSARGRQRRRCAVRPRPERDHRRRDDRRRRPGLQHPGEHRAGGAVLPAGPRRGDRPGAQDRRGDRPAARLPEREHHRHRRLRDLPDHRLGLRPSAADRGLARAAAPRAGAARPSLNQRAPARRHSAASSDQYHCHRLLGGLRSLKAVPTEVRRLVRARPRTDSGLSCVRIAACSRSTPGDSSGGDIRGRQACGRAVANRSKPQPGSSPSPCSGSPWRVGSPARAQAVVPPSTFRTSVQPPWSRNIVADADRLPD